MNLKVVAEGVETAGQCNFLRAHRCDEMQGYYFARPLAPEDCARALAEGRRLPAPEAQAAADVPILLLVDDNERDLDLMQRALGGEGETIIAIGIAISTLGFLSQAILTAPRVYFAMAEDGLFFKQLASLNRARVPALAIALQGGLAAAIALIGSRYEQILNYAVSVDIVPWRSRSRRFFTRRGCIPPPSGPL